MKTKKSTSVWLGAVLIIIVGACVYFITQNSKEVATANNTSSTPATYTSAKYGYAIDISKNLTYKEFNENDGSGGTGLTVTDPAAATPYSQLTINVFTTNPGGAQGGPTTLNGLPATVSVGEEEGDQGNVTEKTYHIAHNGMIYEINIIPADEANFQTVANTFRFTK